MDYMRKSHQISNSFYNLGLERACIRDLTGAAQCLKKSIHFNKYHTDARNLLGLIYYEIGESADALVQWVISMNLQPEDNCAKAYLGEIQGKPRRLEAESQNVKKYNQALIHAQSGSDDLAVLQLTKVVDTKPNFVKAQLVLALLYMSHEDYTKAGKSLYRVLKIDKNNPKALWYMAIVKERTGKADIEKRKLKNAFSHRQMQDDDIILPPTYKENTGWQTIINIIVGLLMGVSAFYVLVLPASTRAMNQTHNKEIVKYSEELNQKNLEITGLSSQMEDYQTQRDAAKADLQAIVDSNGGELSQYQRVIQILQAYRNDDFDTAVKLYVDLNGEVIRDESTLNVIAGIKKDMETKGYQVLADWGSRSAQAGRGDEALDYYRKSLNIKPDNPQVMFDMAMIYKGKEEKDQANELFGQIIKSQGNTELGKKAKKERGY